MDKAKCIYCLEEKSTGEFNREHVIPECLGRFTPINFILYKTVCKKCNSDFGKELEIALGRDSLEGVQRYKYRIKPEKEPASYKRVTFTIPNGAQKGMYIRPRYSETEGMIDSEAVPQIGFRNNSSKEYRYFRVEDLPPLIDLQREGYELSNLRLIGKDEDQLDGLVQTLKKIGITVKLLDSIEEEFERKNEEILVSVEQTIDKVMIRSFAKIAFNYLAYIAGSSFVIKKDFNEIRDFIKNGNRSNEFLRRIDKSILFENKHLDMKTIEGHLIAIRWKGTDSIISHVSLFNEIIYEIVLVRNFKAIWIPLDIGHYFNLKTKEIESL